MLNKRTMNKMERRNNNRLKAAFRCLIHELIAGQETAMREYMIAKENGGPAFLNAHIKECETRISVLKWIMFICRPDDPSTPNQWTKHNGTTANLESAKTRGSSSQSAN